MIASVAVAAAKVANHSFFIAMILKFAIIKVQLPHFESNSISCEPYLEHIFIADIVSMFQF